MRVIHARKPSTWGHPRLLCLALGLLLARWRRRRTLKAPPRPSSSMPISTPTAPWRSSRPSPSAGRSARAVAEVRDARGPGRRPAVRPDARRDHRHRWRSRGDAGRHEDERFTTVTVPTNGATEIVMGYTVTGAVVNVNDGTALRVRLLQGLSAQVAKFEATVQIPTQFTYIKCTAGSPNSTVPCTFAAAGTEAAQIPTFRDGPRGEGEVVAVDIGFPAGTVAANEESSIPGRSDGLSRPSRCRSRSRWVCWCSAASGCCAPPAFRRRRPGGRRGQPGGRVRADRTRTDRVPGGRRHPSRPCRDRGRRAGGPDRRHREPCRPGRTRPPEDNRASPGAEFAGTDWDLPGPPEGRTGSCPSSSSCSTASRPGPARQVSELASRVHESIGGVQNAFYDEVVSNGWYERRPDATRSRWTQLRSGR